MTMLSYHNDPSLKAEFVARMQAHLLADEIIQGQGFVGGRGCAVGCTYDKYDLSLGPTRLGFPEAYERLREAIFEGLPAAQAPAFALASLAAVPVGKCMGGVVAQVLVRMHLRALHLLASNSAPYARQCHSAIQGVIDYLNADDKRGAVAESAAESAAQAAESARAAVRSAESVWATRAAAFAAWAVALTWPPAEPAARAAESAARAARAARTARTAAWAAEYQVVRDDLLEVVRGLAADPSSTHAELLGPH